MWVEACGTNIFICGNINSLFCFSLNLLSFLFPFTSTFWVSEKIIKVITVALHSLIYRMRWQARDFDPDSLRFGLTKAVSSLDWAISEGKGRVYLHCTAGLGRAPAVAIAYMFWFCDMDVSPQMFTSVSALISFFKSIVVMSWKFAAKLRVSYFSGFDLSEQLNTAYSILTSKRPCGPNKRALRGELHMI